MASIDSGSQAHSIVKSFDDAIDVLKIAPPPIAIRIDEVSTALSYFGFAVAGSSGAVAVWMIKRITLLGTVTSLELADGNGNYDNVWNNRAVLSYS